MILVQHWAEALKRLVRTKQSWANRKADGASQMAHC
jgi:hypothetical protein